MEIRQRPPVRRNLVLLVGPQRFLHTDSHALGIGANKAAVKDASRQQVEFFILDGGEAATTAWHQKHIVEDMDTKNGKWPGFTEDWALTRSYTK